jgi:hypothetical protein
LCADLPWLPPEPPDAEDEEEEANEFRDPTRITVPFDSLDTVDPAVIQLARGVIGDADEEEEDEDDEAGPRIVRPPEWKEVFATFVSWMAVVRIQRSGAAYWYASMSFILGESRRVSKPSK